MGYIAFLVTISQSLFFKMQCGHFVGDNFYSLHIWTAQQIHYIGRFIMYVGLFWMCLFYSRATLQTDTSVKILRKWLLARKKTWGEPDLFKCSARSITCCMSVRWPGDRLIPQPASDTAANETLCEQMEATQCRRRRKVMKTIHGCCSILCACVRLCVCLCVCFAVQEGERFLEWE